MNIFYIPSWYPSTSDPIYGIFIKEEIELMARYFPADNFGISTWGQGEEDLLLWSGQPFNSIKKLFQKHEKRQLKIGANITEYFNPRLIWTRKFLNGNIENIKKANEANFLEMQKDVGTVDIVHVYASYPGVLLAAHLEEKYDVPFVLTSHMSPFPFSEFLNKDGNFVNWLEKPIKRAKRIIATSRKAANDISGYGFDNLEIIPIGRDFDLFKPVSWQNKNPILLAVGRLVHQKGFDLLLQALAKSTFTGKLRIIGEGADREKLEKMADVLSISDRVFFGGQKNRSGVIEEMQKCDAFILSSRHETFGNVVVEAAACGKPVISTKCGGPEDIINEKIGILIENENLGAMVCALDNIPGFLSRYNSQEVRKDILNRFGTDKILHQVFDVYKRVLS